MKNWKVIRQFSNRNKKLKEAGIGSYADFLKSPIWKEIHKRYEKKVAEGIKRWIECYCCGDSSPFHLHHLNYKSVVRPILGSRIVPLCARCHKRVHELTEKHLGWSIKKVTNHLRKKSLALGNIKRNLRRNHR